MGSTASPSPDANLPGTTASQAHGARPSSQILSHGGSWQPPSVAELQGDLPQYQVLEFFARGGMGAVYKARQKSLKRMVAIKVLPSQLLSDEFEFRGRFEREAETMAALSHPNIVAVHDFGETVGGLLFFVMEFVAGSDVASLIQQRAPLPVGEAAAIMDAVCDALTYAHKHGVVHRDIKPANVLLDPEGRVKVADFGLAKAVGESMQTGLTRTNVVMGTQEFAAPEMLIPGRTVDHRADIYSAGVMLYLMLTGEIPRVMFKLPSLRRPELGTRFDAMICKALETDPADRFESATTMKSAIESALHGGTAAKKQVKADKNSRAPFFIAATTVVMSLAAGTFLLSRHASNAASSSNGTGRTTGVTSTVLEPGALRLWDAPDKVPDQAGVRWERSAVRLDHSALVYPALQVRDAAARAEILMNPDRSSPEIAIRHREPKKGEVFCYAVAAHAKDGTIKLQSVVSGSWTVLKEWPLPRAYGPDEWLKLELRAVGDELSVFAEDRLIGTVHDASQPEGGSVMLWAEEKGYFRNIVFVLLDKPATAQVTGKVVDLLPLVDVKRDAIHPVWSKTPEGAVRCVRDRDANAGRIEFPYAPPAEYDFEVEFTVEEGGSGYVVQVFAVPGHWLDWRLLPPPAFGPSLDGVEPGNGPRTEGIGKLYRLKPGDRHRSVVEVRTNSLRAVVDGIEISRYIGDFKRLSDSLGIFKLRDTRHLGVGVVDIGLLIHKAVVREISGAGKVDASGQAKDSLEENTDVPAIANWQDVTEDVRAKARNIPNLVVESGSVRHSGSGPTVSFPLTGPGIRDYAVRLQFVSDGQVDLRSNPSGFIYVLCQHEKTIMHRYEVGGANNPELLHPNVPNPSDFDLHPKHELLVTMRGPTVRTWLDGRFVGEAQDTKFPEGEARVLITPSSVVNKVEVAELAASR